MKQREAFLAEMEALRNRLSGLDLAIQLITQGENDGTERERGHGITSTILRLLTDAGAAGISAEGAVEAAARQGIELNRSSVSSLLSRLKRAGTVVYADKRYILKESSSGS